MSGALNVTEALQQTQSYEQLSQKMLIDQLKKMTEMSFLLCNNHQTLGQIEQQTKKFNGAEAVDDEGIIQEEKAVVDEQGILFHF